MPHEPGPARASDSDLFERFGIEDTAERTRLLRALAEARALVTLHTQTQLDGQVVSQVVGVDVAQGTVDLEFNTDETRRDAFCSADLITAVALLDRVTLQCELPRATIFGDGDRGRLRAPLPVRLARLQRRDAYRVEPPIFAMPRLWLRGEQAVHILDVSATGLAFEWAAETDAPRPGERLSSCRLELLATAPFRCDLLVRTTAPRADPFSDPADGVPLRVGCAFDALEPSAARAVQVFVNLAQSGGRKARPRVG